MRWTLPREAGVETLAGFLLAQFGHIPAIGEAVIYDKKKFVVAEMEGQRISRVRVESLADETPTTNDATRETA